MLFFRIALSSTIKILEEYHPKLEMFSTAEGYHQYIGLCSDVQYYVEGYHQFCRGIQSILWMVFKTMEVNHKHCGVNAQSACGFLPKY